MDDRRTRNGKRRERFLLETLDDLGVKIKKNATVKEIETVYRHTTHKNPPSYTDKISFWLKTEFKKKPH